jgi:hypothetical protein
MATETETGAEPSGIEKMVADAVSDLKGFCDSMRSDFGALNARMDSMESGRRDSTDEADVAGVAVETPAEGMIEVSPASDLEEDAPMAGDRIGATEEAAENATTPTEIAADAGMDMDAMADAVAHRVAAPLRADIERLSRMMPAELSIEQRQAFANTQEQAETAFQSFGDHAPAPMQGEGIGTYKRRLASKMQGHSSKWKGTKLTSISDEATLDVIIADIYNDAAAVARRGADVAVGQLMPVSRRTPAGHTIIEYRGSPGAWMRPLAGATRRATGKFNTGR